MNIEFESVKLTNFLSLGSVQVDLRERGFVLVEGVNNCSLDGAKSNGAGKSSIFEGIVWVLTGDTSRGVKDVVNKAIGGSTCGELEFTIDGNKYKIIRFREDPVYGNTLKVYFNGEDVSGKGVRDSNKILEQYLPDLNAQLLGSVIVLGQGLPQRFTNNTPSGRKEILEQLSKSDFMIEDIKSRLSLRRSDVQTELRGIKDTIISKQSTISSMESLISTKRIELENLPSPDIYESNIRTLETRRSQVDKDKSDILLEIERYTVESRQFESEISKEQQVISEEQKQVEAPVLEAIRVVSEAIAVESYKEADLGKKIRDASSVQTICPYCRRPFDDVHKVDTTEWEKELAECKKLQQTKQSEKDTLNKQLSDIRAEFNKRSQALQETISKMRMNNIQIDTLNRKVSSAESEIHSINLDIVNQQNQLNALEQKKHDIGEALTTFQNNLESASSELVELTKNQGVAEEKVEALNKLVNIASKDFRTYLLESVIEYIDTRFKYYASKLFNSTQAEFRSLGNQIWIGYCGKQYEALSGGEKQKCDLSVQFAIRDMLMKILRFSCNILVLDEVFDNLDNFGCDSLINLITSELKDIESVYIITHHSDISIPYDDKITIVKNEEGISNIENL